MQAALLSHVEYDTKWYTKSKFLDEVHRLSLATKMRSQRNKYILSAGHLAPALYAVLAQKEVFDELIEAQHFSGLDISEKRQEYLKTIRSIDGDLEGHPSLVHSPFVIDASTGPLGQGAGTSVGYALNDSRSAGKSGSGLHTFALLGDGECQEGQVWEAAMNAAKFKLANLTWVVDRNFIQIDGDTESVGGLDLNHELSDEFSGLANKFKSFGWVVSENLDGNDYEKCNEAIEKSIEWQKESGLPGVIINYTKVGYPFKQFGTYKWHGKTPTEAEAIKAAGELKDETV